MSGVAAAFTWAPGLAIVNDVYPGEAKAMGMYPFYFCCIFHRISGIALSGYAVGMVAGPPVGGLMLRYLGYIFTYSSVQNQHNILCYRLMIQVDHIVYLSLLCFIVCF